MICPFIDKEKINVIKTTTNNNNENTDNTKNAWKKRLETVYRA